LLKLAQLPPVVLNAFDSPAAIHEGWGLELKRALEDPERRQSVIRVARRISQAPRPPAPEVYRLLLSPVTNGRRLPKAGRDEVVKDKLGAPLFRIRQQRSYMAFLIPLNRMAPDVFASLRQAIERTLQHSKDSSRGGEPALRLGSSSAPRDAGHPPS
jgi:hypothetical protein